MFDCLTAPKADSLMEIGQMFRADSRADKIDLGVGTYRNDRGAIEIMASVKEAERRLLVARTSKGYVGPGGDATFCALLGERLMPGLGAILGDRFTYVQTPGGTGAFRLGLELAAYARPSARLLVGTPTWPNHLPIAKRVGLECVTYAFYNPESEEVDLQAMETAIMASTAGDLLLLHGCCHNPTGASLTMPDWAAIAGWIGAAGVVPVIDLAYPGLAKGLASDVAGTRLILETVPEAIVAVSCSKSFGLYSERTGMLGILGANRTVGESCRLTAETLARALWSNPPDHGAAIVRTILEDPDLDSAWTNELDGMRTRIATLRHALSGARLPGAERIGEQEGLFAVLALSAQQIAMLRQQHAIYMDASGRINIAGLNSGNLDRFLASCSDVF